MMKKDITVYVNSKTSMVDLHSSRLGISGENLQGNLVVKFDDEFVNGTAILEIQRNDEKYYLVMQKENESYYLPILSSLLSETTTIIMQIRITEGTDNESIPVWKSNKFYLKVEEAINAEIPIPEEYEEWIDIANAKLNEIDNIDIDVNKVGNTATVSITKKDGTEKSVEIYDGPKGEDGVDGQDGRDGQDGYTPQKGIDYFTEQDIEEIEGDILNEVYTKSETDTLLGEKADIEDIPDVSNFITNSVNNLLNYYLKSETYTKQEVNNLIGQIATLQFQVVSTLPQIGDSKYIYLVPSSNPKTQNVKDEYIWVNNSWEQIGSTQIDLTGYATENWVNTQISEFLTQTQIQALINTALSEYTETDPTVPSYVKNITQANITSWNNKSDFSGNYNDLTNKPKINNVELNGNKSLNDLGMQPAGNYALESDMIEAQNDIENLQTENARLKATLPTTTGEGQDITLDKTAEMEFVKPPLPRGNTKQDTTTGKNLLNTSNANTTTINGVTSYRNNGFYYLSGTNTKTDATWVLPNTQNTNLPTFEIGQTYTMSVKGTLPSGVYAQLNGFKTSTGTQYSIGSVMRTVPYITFTIDSDYSSTAQLFIGIQGATTNADCNFAIQIEKGSTATSYEPYTGGIPSPNPGYPQEIRNVTGNVEVIITNNDNTESKTLSVSLGNIELCIIGNYQDVFIKENNDWKIPNKTIKIDNYNGETITTPYISTTGGLDIGATVYYVGTNDLLITDATLISQLEEISKTLSYQGQTNITSNTIALFDVEAYQSTKLILENLDSRLTLVEG